VVARRPLRLSPGRDFFLVTCEHAGNRVPRELARHFRGLEATLATHRGYDHGALAMARDLARDLDAPLVASTVSRLVVDLNRSLSNPRVWSSATRALPRAERDGIARRYYLPHWQRVDAIVTSAARSGRRVVHIASHSFTPSLDGVRRTADVGLLYDPSRAAESGLASRWRASLRALAPALRVRRNYPYAGKGDGLTRALRRTLPPTRYIGIELELNQALAVPGGAGWSALRRTVCAALRTALAAEGATLSSSPSSPRSPR